MRIESLRKYMFPALKALALLFCITEGLVGSTLKMRTTQALLLGSWSTHSVFKKGSKEYNI